MVTSKSHSPPNDILRRNNHDKKVITFALLLAIIALPFVQVNAAGKTVAGFKNNSYASQGYSDAKIVVDGVYAKDSAYSKNYKEGYDVSQSDFFSKNHTINIGLAMVLPLDTYMVTQTTFPRK